MGVNTEEAGFISEIMCEGKEEGRGEDAGKDRGKEGKGLQLCA